MRARRVLGNCRRWCLCCSRRTCWWRLLVVRVSLARGLEEKRLAWSLSGVKREGLLLAWAGVGLLLAIWAVSRGQTSKSRRRAEGAVYTSRWRWCEGWTWPVKHARSSLARVDTAAAVAPGNNAMQSKDGGDLLRRRLKVQHDPHATAEIRRIGGVGAMIVAKEVNGDGHSRGYPGRVVGECPGCQLPLTRFWPLAASISLRLLQSQSFLRYNSRDGPGTQTQGVSSNMCQPGVATTILFQIQQQRMHENLQHHTSHVGSLTTAMGMAVAGLMSSTIG